MTNKEFINNMEPPREKILDYVGLFVVLVIFTIGFGVGFIVKSLI